ncbi:uncharacterized protein V6R79_003841 [Siganus canaliculatus]
MNAALVFKRWFCFTIITNTTPAAIQSPTYFLCRESEGNNKSCTENREDEFYYVKAQTFEWFSQKQDERLHEMSLSEEFFFTTVKRSQTDLKTRRTREKNKEKNEEAETEERSLQLEGRRRHTDAQSRRSGVVSVPFILPAQRGPLTVSSSHPTLMLVVFTRQPPGIIPEPRAQRTNHRPKPCPGSSWSHRLIGLLLCSQR